MLKQCLSFLNVNFIYFFASYEQVNINKIFLQYTTLLNCTSIEDVRIDKCVNWCPMVYYLCKNFYYRMN